MIVANLFDTNPAAGKARSFGGSPEADTFIYWGGPDGFSPSRRTVLPSVGNEDVAAADLDGDGRLDLALTSYHAGSTRDNPSYIYWNRAGGFDPKAVARLETHSASGVLAADFDRDGRKDLFFTCHSRDGNHRTDSFLYLGTPAGFSSSRRSSIPGLGPHFMTVLDIGNIYDRGERYGYVSPPFDAGPGRGSLPSAGEATRRFVPVSSSRCARRRAASPSIGLRGSVPAGPGAGMLRRALSCAVSRPAPDGSSTGRAW